MSNPFHACSYCGGFEEKDFGIETAWFAYTHIPGASRRFHNGQHVFSAVVSHPSLGVFREICYKCYIKVFDAVLGQPK